MSFQFEALLAKKRKNDSITQQEIADEFELDSCQFVSNCERQKCRWPVSYFKKLSKIFNIPILELVMLRTEDIHNEIWSEINGKGGKK